jgi:LuxR family transcriptional regulator, maltose regulon positive regulatory protein
MPETTRILRTKFHEPPIRGDHVHRVRLIEKLNNNYQKNALILVSAPAGYGKSNLISCWLTNNKIPFAWISLDEHDNDLRTFLEYITKSTENRLNCKLEKTSGLLEAPELPPFSVITNTLINELDEMEKEFVLVLDDYHNIRDEKIHGLIDNLLQYPPDNMLLCIITRKDPPIRIGSLRAYNRMNEVRAKDLSFTIEEIPVLYKNMLGLELDEEISELLLERTEGWVTGLRLTAFSINSVEQLKKMLNNMKGNSLLVTDYLIEEVLSMQPERFQKYLLKSSLLDRFCSDVIEELNFTNDGKEEDGVSGKEFIEWLEKTNLFTILLDDEHKWFRYHHLFRELLYKQLKKKTSPEQICYLHKKIGEWFEKNNFVKPAISHLLEAGNPEIAAGIVERFSTKAMDADNWWLLEEWLKILPVEIVNQSVKLQIVSAWIAKMRFRFAELLVALDRAEELMGKHPSGNADYGEWCYLMSFFKTFVEGDISGSLSFVKRAIKLVPDEPKGTFRAELELQVAMSRHIAGKSTEAVKKLDEQISEQTKKSRFWERLQYGLCAIYMMKGELHNAYDNAVILKDSSVQIGNHYAEGWSRFFLGSASLQLFKLDDALHQYSKVMELRYITYDRASIDCLIGLAITYQLLGETYKADNALLTIRDYIKWTGDPAQIILYNATRIRIELLRGNLDEAVKWQRSLNAEPHFPSMVFFQCNPFITECAVLLAEGTNSNLALASKKLEKLYNGTKKFNYQFHSVDILVLQSVLKQKQGHINKAAEVMEKALELAVKSGWIRPFIEAGTCVIDILNHLIKRNIYVDYCKKIIEVFENYEKRPLTNISLQKTSGETLNEPLTQRELEILSLLSLGLKNREIGDRIFLAPTTVKKHIYNIYQKLDVHSRIEVISKVRELGLFESKK